MPFVRRSSLFLVLSGLFFVLYPAIRPFSDEVSLAGAEAFASTSWVVAHLLAIVAFTLLPIGLMGLYASMPVRSNKAAISLAVVVSVIGVGLTLPFYGGETYGLQAIGRAVVAQQEVSMMSQATEVRSGPGLILFLIGMLLLAVAAVIVAITIWRSGKVHRWSGIPYALGMALFIPQFFVDQPLRVAHGVLLAVGCIGIAHYVLKHTNGAHAPARAR